MKTASKTVKATKTTAKKTTKAKVAKKPVIKMEAGAIIEPVTGESEAELPAIQNDISSAKQQAEGIEPQDVVRPNPEPETVIQDELSHRQDANNWNWNDATAFESINLRENSNVLNRFEYLPSVLQVGTKKTKYSILTCSDTGAIVGKPFADSYGLLNNGDFIGVIESICNVLDSRGLKWKVTTTGTLANRERMFISLEIEPDASTETIDGREFHAFLNCLNSIPSNQGCTVTFANNTFCVCCKNTFAHVLHGRDGSKFHAALKHSRGLKAALNDIPVLVEAYFSGNEKLFANLKTFNVFPVSISEAEEFLAAFIGRDLKGNLTDKTELKTRSGNMVEKLKELFVKGKGNKGETAFDLFQGVTEFYTHFSAGQSEDTSKQFESSEGGAGYQSKNEFYQWLLAATQSTSNWQGICKVGNTLLVNYRKAK